jgi:hypothetical protein
MPEYNVARPPQKRDPNPSFPKPSPFLPYPDGNITVHMVVIKDDYLSRDCQVKGANY